MATNPYESPGLVEELPRQTFQFNVLHVLVSWLYICVALSAHPHPNPVVHWMSLGIIVVLGSLNVLLAVAILVVGVTHAVSWALKALRRSEK